MRKENDELTNLFRTRLEHAEMPVRDNFWEKLENDIPVVLNNRRRMMIRRFSAAASVLLILGVASASFWYFSPKDEIADAFQQVAVSNGIKGTIIQDGIKEELTPVPISHVAANNKPVRVMSGMHEVEEMEEESFSFSISMSFSVTEEYGSNQYNQNQRAGGLQNVHTAQQEQQVASTPEPTPAKEKKDRKWAVGLAASVSPGAGTSEIASTLPQQEFYNQIKHKPSFSAGMTLKRELSKHFALETGLIYTQLNSELSGNTDSYYKQDQKLHYIGIPLKASYTLLDTGKFDMYASAGGMLEKCVAGKMKPDPLQFSVLAGVGVEYKLNERMSVYAEPGLTYSFDDGSPVTTIRKEKPLNFNLLCGVRMTY